MPLVLTKDEKEVDSKTSYEWKNIEDWRKKCVLEKFGGARRIRTTDHLVSQFWLTKNMSQTPTS